MIGKRKPSPFDKVRETLFGDAPLDEWPPDHQRDTLEFPWNVFVDARAELRARRTADAIADWRRILEQPGLEARHYLQAWHYLRQVGENPSSTTARLVLGVVAEVALPEGLDVLAAYADHSARYYNHSGSGVVWDHPDNSLDQRIDSLIAASEDVVREIGPWDGARPPSPPRGQARVSFLTPAGLHFGQGPMDAILEDPKGGPVLHLATLLMSDLIQRTNAT